MSKKTQSTSKWHAYHLTSPSCCLSLFRHIFHNGTNKQSADIGYQYRSAYFCKDKAQLAAVNAYVENLKQYGQNIITDTHL